MLDSEAEVQPVNAKPRPNRLPTGLVALLALAALTAAIWTPGAAGKSASAQKCGDVVVNFKPEGSGGAHKIRATGIDCEPARNIARSCVEGTVAAGWTAVLWDGRIRIAKESKRIVYIGVGGGGCGYLQESCHDFSYRGVGFFNLEVAGPGCGSGKATAKSWYDAGGDCSFGHACDVGLFHCKANANTGTVTCVRPDGFRVRWQMGE